MQYLAKKKFLVMPKIFDAEKYKTKMIEHF